MSRYSMRGYNSGSKDRGPQPYVVNVKAEAIRNQNFRTALWTGTHLQMTLMDIPVHEDIGTEMHQNVDQCIRVEAGDAMVRMGDSKDRLPVSYPLHVGDVVFVPQGTWHNIYNTGSTPLKLSSIYAPPQHPRGTIHHTKADAAHK